MNRMEFLRMLAAVSMTTSTSAQVLAQGTGTPQPKPAPGAPRPKPAEPRIDFPTKTVKLIVPFAPGGGTDVVARLLAQRLSENLGKQFVIENRSGAGGTIGTDAVAKAAPDGYTLLFAPSSHVVNPGIYPKLPYDTEKDFEPISLVASAAILLAVNSDVPAKDLREFVALAKMPGNKYSNYGSAGNGTVFHLLTEQFLRAADIRLQHIPYRGGAPAVGALVTKEVPILFETAITLQPFTKAGNARALAIASRTRSPIFPDVPTVVEQGMPQLAASNDYALYAPAGTPQPIIRKLHAETVKALSATHVKAILYVQATTGVGSTPEALRTYVSTEIKRWSTIARDANIKVS